MKINDEVEEPKSVQVVLTSDLEGFWEMIEIQVKDVEKKFNYLAKLKANQYEPLPIEIVKVISSENSKAVNKQASFKQRAIKVNNVVNADAKSKPNGKNATITLKINTHKIANVL